MKTSCYLLLVFFLFLPGSPAAAEAGVPLIIGHFSADDLSGWQSKEFLGQTDYRLISLAERRVLQAEADASASGLFKEVEVDLRATPFLNWEWMLQEALPPLQETTKAGDDYGARIYVVVKGGLLFWKTRALNYVWSSSQPKESIWPNAFAGKNAMLLAVRSAEDGTNRWYREKRNVYQELKKIFGEEIRSIDAIAIMTDSDNSGGSTRAVYGDIFFSAD